MAKYRSTAGLRRSQYDLFFHGQTHNWGSTANAGVRLAKNLSN